MEIKKNKYSDKFEFMLRINDNIVCQRYFNIRGYNNKAKDSMELKWDLEEMVKSIQSYLKGQSEEFLWATYNPYSPNNSVVRKEEKKEEDYFTFEIRVDGKVIIVERFTGMDFPPKIRYSVNIRTLIPMLISTIQRGLSKRDYTDVRDYYIQS